MGFLNLFKKIESADDIRNKGVVLYEEKKYQRAAECFTKAMEMGMREQKCCSAQCCWGGTGILQDIGKGILHIKNAADKDYPPAVMSMTEFYAKGVGVEQDSTHAFRLMKKAAETDYSEAQRGLGDFYAYGIGTDENPKMAACWYQKAADQGNAEAQYMLGLMYAAGSVFDSDLEKAAHLWEAAAAQGHEGARKNLTDLARNMA